MKASRSVFAMLMFACLGATPARPGTLALRWGACAVDGGTANRNFACATNAGEHLLVGSFRMSQPLQGVTGIEIVVDVVAQSDELPAWWGFRSAGSCRTRALVVDGSLAPAAKGCVDWAGGMSAGGLAAYRIHSSGPHVARMIAGFAVAADAAADLASDREYFAFNARISSAGTTGSAACGGCAVPACIVFARLRVATPPGPSGEPSRDVAIQPSTDSSDLHVASWQDVSERGLPDRGICPGATAPRDSVATAAPGARR